MRIAYDFENGLINTEPSLQIKQNGKLPKSIPKNGQKCSTESSLVMTSPTLSNMSS